MKNIFFLLLSFAAFTTSDAQLYLTRNANVGFYSKTPLEDIDAVNNQAYGIIDVSKKTIAFSMLMKGFTFKKELMQEHFNENYVESDQYPKATFTGSFAEPVDVAKDGTYTLHVSGTITMHGVSKPFTTIASLSIQAKTLHTNAAFTLIPQDYNITIPSLVKDKIANEIHVTVQATLNP